MECSDPDQSRHLDDGQINGCVGGSMDAKATAEQLKRECSLLTHKNEVYCR